MTSAKSPAQGRKKTSLRAIKRSLGSREKPMYESTGVVEASVNTVRKLLTDVSEGEAGKHNAVLLHDPSGDKVTLKGGPNRFSLPYGSAEVDREKGSFAEMGNWWYKGIFTAEPHPKGARLVLRVYNHAAKFRMFVPLTQFGLAACATEAMDKALQRITAATGLRTYRER
ncbi:hypothetical protein FM076_10220 [Streptomyces albus subsp. chlorinus]|uniref:hypothetical protein n=1 Tax=Streptomyces albus TaxID=1888 RepID=UPI00157028DC|nr:hypothetical protein [Streptomyces albus]NSC21559.1 hypothetical protein [Streptomyces albus subsp. chlorinus]